MDVMEARRRILIAADPDLPPGYKRVEYLQSSGTQYMSSGVIPADDLDITIDLSVTGPALTANRNYVIGMSGGSFRIAFSFSTASYYGWGNGGQSNEPLSIDTERHIITMDRTAFKVDGVTVFVPYSHEFLTTTFNPYLFARNATGSAADITNGVRVYRVTIKKSGTVVRNFIPCVRGSDSKPGLYDTVSKTLFTNLGTGEFITP